MKNLLKSFRIKRLGAVLALATFALALFAPAARAEAPDELIQRLSADVLAQIKADKEIQAGNPQRISKLVDATIMPNVNFERMTALAVGRGWREATPEQHSQLIAQFRTLLLRTYSGALAQVRDQTVRMKPFRADPKDTEVIVRSEIVGGRGRPIQLDYRVQKLGDNWRIFDLNVLGVWLVETYRNQFSQEVNANGIDGLIRSLTEKNKQFAQG